MQSPPKFQFFKDRERAILNYIWKNKMPRIAKKILNNKRTSRGITISELNIYYRAIVKKKGGGHGIGTETDRLINGIDLKTQK
jgi:hypothetical protein